MRTGVSPRTWCARRLVRLPSAVAGQGGRRAAGCHTEVCTPQPPSEALAALSPRVQASASRARVLEVVEEELEERWAALGRPAGRASQDAPYLRRLHQANLPPAELHLCKDLLRKLAAIDASREAAEGVRRVIAASHQPAASQQLASFAALPARCARCRSLTQSAAHG